MQLVSSQIGVAIIRLFGISVFLEGNVIDLGNYKLQVAEACNGLRYLFPLMALGFIAAYLFKGAWWKRALHIPVHDSHYDPDEQLSDRRYRCAGGALGHIHGRRVPARFRRLGDFHGVRRRARR